MISKLWQEQIKTWIKYLRDEGRGTFILQEVHWGAPSSTSLGCWEIDVIRRLLTKYIIIKGRTCEGEKDCRGLSSRKTKNQRIVLLKRTCNQLPLNHSLLWNYLWANGEEWEYIFSAKEHIIYFKIGNRKTVLIKNIRATRVWQEWSTNIKFTQKRDIGDYKWRYMNSNAYPWDRLHPCYYIRTLPDQGTNLMRSSMSYIESREKRPNLKTKYERNFLELALKRGMTLIK